MSISRLIEKYNRSVPRYTSYPTAVHFNHEISQETYRKNLNTLDKETPVSLYIHIPFCHILCHYCGCFTKVTNSYSPVRSYVETMLKEIDLVGQNLYNRIHVSQIHFGGGSPNFLKKAEFKKIFDKLAEYFDTENLVELAIETDPRLLNEQKIKDLADLGFTRVSLGVQDFDHEVQRAVNRIQPFDQVKDSVNCLREVGINKINFDLMVGLPLQTLEEVKRNLELSLLLSPDRFAVFSYAHVPWMKKHQKLLEKYDRAGTQLRFDMIAEMKNSLNDAGYHSIGIDHFARNDDSLYIAYKEKKLRRNFQGYTDDQANVLLGFGLSSISSFDDVYIQNITDAPRYRKAVDEKEIPIKRGCLLNDDDKERCSVIEQIMCGYKTDISAYSSVRNQLEAFEKDGLIDIDGCYIQVTDKGWPFARLVASSFDAYYVEQDQQHAKAI